VVFEIRGRRTLYDVDSFYLPRGASIAGREGYGVSKYADVATARAQAEYGPSALAIPSGLSQSGRSLLFKIAGHGGPEDRYEIRLDAPDRVARIRRGPPVQIQPSRPRPSPEAVAALKQALGYGSP
jgi:hypothetical protein